MPGLLDYFRANPQMGMVPRYAASGGPVAAAGGVPPTAPAPTPAVPFVQQPGLLDNLFSFRAGPLAVGNAATGAAPPAAPDVPTPSLSPSIRDAPDAYLNAAKQSFGAGDYGTAAGQYLRSSLSLPASLVVRQADAEAPIARAVGGAIGHGLSGLFGPPVPAAPAPAAATVPTVPASAGQPAAGPIGGGVDLRNRQPVQVVSTQPMTPQDYAQIGQVPPGTARAAAPGVPHLNFAQLRMLAPFVQPRMSPIEGAQTEQLQALRAIRDSQIAQAQGDQQKLAEAYRQFLLGTRELYPSFGAIAGPLAAQQYSGGMGY